MGGSNGRWIPVSFVLLAAWLAPVNAREYCIPNGEFWTIQSAIDAAVDGDVIILEAGVYTGYGNCNISFQGKAIVVRSVNPDDPDVVAATVIDAEGELRGFEFSCGETAAAVLRGVTITGAQTGIYCRDASPTIKGCAIQCNAGHGILCEHGAKPVISGCRIIKNAGRGIFFWNSNVLAALTVDNCTIHGNHDGGIYCQGCRYTIVNSEISENGEKGILCEGGSSDNVRRDLIANCVIRKNVTNRPTFCVYDYKGGGIYLQNSRPIIRGCLIAGNRAPDTRNGDGGGVYADAEAAPLIVNCTIVGNVAGRQGNGLAARTAVVQNCILWGDNQTEIFDNVSEDNISRVDVTYSDVRGGWPGMGNIDSDPLFLDHVLYHISPKSPCYNTGDPAGVYHGLTDLDGESRVVDGRVDMGCDEYRPARHSPLAIDDYVETYPDREVVIDVLANDVDLDNDTLTLVRVTRPRRGVAKINADKATITYTPGNGFAGMDEFRYTVTDNNGGVATACVYVEVVAQYKLTATVVEGSGTVTPSGGKYYRGTVVSLVALPDLGYAVKAWKGTDNDSCTVGVNQVTMSRARTVTVAFTPDPSVRYRLITKVRGEHGTIKPVEHGFYEPMTVVTLTATPDLHYRVGKWEGTDNNASTENTNTVTMNTEKVVTVEFTKQQYEVGATVIGQGAVWPMGGTYDAGLIIVLTARPAPGFRVKQWAGTDNDSATGLQNTFTVGGDGHITVEFEPDTDLTVPTVSPTPADIAASPPPPNACGTAGVLIILISLLVVPIRR